MDYLPLIVLVICIGLLVCLFKLPGWIERSRKAHNQKVSFPERTQTGPTGVRVGESESPLQTCTKCPSCGASIKVNSRFCSYCGTPVPESANRFEFNANINMVSQTHDEAKIIEAEARKKEVEAKSRNQKLMYKLIFAFALILLYAIIVSINLR